MKPVVKQDAEKEIPTEIMASAIVSLAEGMRKLRSGRLNDKALFLLIQNVCTTPRPAIRDIQEVLWAVGELERTYIKKLPSK